ncbi:MAG: znuC [Acidimicrobiia bacterium]|nr:znuC [Acidimicrobiia bacterium]
MSAVSATQLSVGYDNHAVVSNITVSIEPGQALALVGTNGSGKSTLLKTIVALQPWVAGSLTVLDDVPGRQPARVAYLGQSHSSRFVLPLQTVDVVRMGRFSALGLRGRASKRDAQLVDEAMEAMGITELAGKPLRLLSGGQQQRVHMAQVLAHDADLLVLDEPTAGLDVTGRDYFRRALEAARARGAAVVTATHDIGEARECDEVLLLARQVIAQGSPGEVLTAEHLLATFGVALHGLEHADHHDLMITEEPHGHDHDHH